MRWRVGAVLALAAALVVGYWEAIVPHPDARPRVVASASAGAVADLGPVRARLVAYGDETSLSPAEIAREAGPIDLPAGASLVRATVELAPSTAAPPTPAPSTAQGCQVRLVTADGSRSWLPLTMTVPCAVPGPGATTTLHAWFALPGGIRAPDVLVEVRTTGTAPRAVHLTPTLA